MDKQQAYYNLWSSFNIPAYEELSVPDDAVFPYITYQVLLDDIDGIIFPTASLWYRGTSWTEIDAKLEEISEFIEDMSPIPLKDGGYMHVDKGTPWAQPMAEDNDRTVRRYLLNLSVEFFTRT